MKHKIAWSMNGTVEFDSDETDLDAIAEDFDSAVSEGFDFMRRGEVDGWSVDEVNDQHIHHWTSVRQDGFDRCFGCGKRRPHTHSWRPKFRDQDREQCSTCFEIRSKP